jgi:hypothetical protein
MIPPRGDDSFLSFLIQFVFKRARRLLRQSGNKLVSIWHTFCATQIGHLLAFYCAARRRLPGIFVIKRANCWEFSFLPPRSDVNHLEFKWWPLRMIKFSSFLRETTIVCGAFIWPVGAAHLSSIMHSTFKQMSAKSRLTHARAIADKNIRLCGGRTNFIRGSARLQTTSGTREAIQRRPNPPYLLVIYTSCVPLRYGHRRAVRKFVQEGGGYYSCYLSHQSDRYLPSPLILVVDNKSRLWGNWVPARQSFSVVHPLTCVPICLDTKRSTNWTLNIFSGCNAEVPTANSLLLYPDILWNPKNCTRTLGY